MIKGEEETYGGKEGERQRMIEREKMINFERIRCTKNTYSGKERG